MSVRRPKAGAAGPVHRPGIRRILTLLFTRVTLPAGVASRTAFACFSISLLLAWAVVAVWVRSYWVADFLSCRTAWVEEGAGATKGEFYLVLRPFGNARGLSPRPFHQRAEPAAATSKLSRELGDEPWPFGFGMSGPAAGGVTVVALPCWFPLVLLIPLAVRFRLSYRRHRFRLLLAAGRCTRCGYDLRGSPGRCPECGAASDPDGSVRPTAVFLLNRYFKPVVLSPRFDRAASLVAFLASLLFGLATTFLWVRSYGVADFIGYGTRNPAAVAGAASGECFLIAWTEDRLGRQGAFHEAYAPARAHAIVSDKMRFARCGFGFGCRLPFSGGQVVVMFPCWLIFLVFLLLSVRAGLAYCFAGRRFASAAGRARPAARRRMPGAAVA